MRTVVIRFHPQQDERALLIHRLRNFGEAVTDVHAKKLRRLTGWIQEKADLRNLRIIIEVV